MTMPVTPWAAPEDEELARKREELGQLEGELAEQETLLATLLIEMRRFERRYVRVVGKLYAQLDVRNAEIAEILDSFPR